MLITTEPILEKIQKHFKYYGIKSSISEQKLDFEAMLDDKIFVNKCESNGGIWNYTPS